MQGLSFLFSLHWNEKLAALLFLIRIINSFWGTRNYFFLKTLKFFHDFISWFGSKKRRQHQPKTLWFPTSNRSENWIMFWWFALTLFRYSCFSAALSHWRPGRKMTTCIQGVLNTNTQGTISQHLSLYILSPSSNASSRPECEIKKYESDTHDRPIEFMRYCCENL